MKIVGLLLLLCTGFLAAQTTATELESLIDNPAVTYAQAARFVLEAADVTIKANPAEAFNYAAERNWLPKKAMPGDAAKFNGISLLLMKSFNLKGGFLYSITKNSHYAYRELVYLGVIQGRTDPYMTVSGDDFLYMVSRILSIKEAEEQKQKGKKAAGQLAALHISGTRVHFTGMAQNRLEEITIPFTGWSG